VPVSSNTHHFLLTKTALNISAVLPISSAAGLTLRVITALLAVVIFVSESKPLTESWKVVELAFPLLLMAFIEENVVSSANECSGMAERRIIKFMIIRRIYFYLFSSSITLSQRINAMDKYFTRNVMYGYTEVLLHSLPTCRVCYPFLLGKSTFRLLCMPSFLFQKKQSPNSYMSKTSLFKLFNRS